MKDTQIMLKFFLMGPVKWNAWISHWICLSNMYNHVWKTSLLTFWHACGDEKNAEWYEHSNEKVEQVYIKSQVLKQYFAWQQKCI